MSFVFDFNLLSIIARGMLVMHVSIVHSPGICRPSVLHCDMESSMDAWDIHCSRAGEGTPIISLSTPQSVVGVYDQHPRAAPGTVTLFQTRDDMLITRCYSLHGLTVFVVVISASYCCPPGMFCQRSPKNCAGLQCRANKCVRLLLSKLLEFIEDALCQD